MSTLSNKLPTTIEADAAMVAVDAILVGLLSSCKMRRIFLLLGLFL